MKTVIKKFYPVFISLLLGFPIFTITYFATEEKYHGNFWFLMIIYFLFTVIQQFKWYKNEQRT